MFIVINKIVTKYKKDNEDKLTKHPVSLKPLLEGMKVVQETIRIDEIKSAREYHNPTKYNDNGIEGPVTVIYLKGDGVRSKLPEIHINESIKSWNKRISAVELNK